VTDHLDDVISDLSAFHRIDDAGEMEAAVFFKLIYRLPAYRGVIGNLAAQAQQGTASRGRAPSSYERGSAMENNARVADHAPPATGAKLAELSASLGGGWISHRVVKAGG